MLSISSSLEIMSKNLKSRTPKRNSFNYIKSSSRYNERIEKFHRNNATTATAKTGELMSLNNRLREMMGKNFTPPEPKPNLS
ncbi:hypothetical protein CEXT_634941 [Caerostris extrusa]|uniref:Uncharacterized protein n=1 Tax=Caerostris extrusa TaxID=172846 RepID=A0AAV4WFY0_CAEEX|nr:hypothetical protein CEXT_634941 [Caerostris extrusa]